MTIIDREQTIEQKTCSLLTKETQQNAADFDPETPFTDIRQMGGEVLKRSGYQGLKDIGKEWLEQLPKRVSNTTLVTVDGQPA